MVKIADSLPVGRAHAITGETLAELLGCSPRDISQAIERARKGGVPACASCASARPGYYLAETPDELALYLSSLDRRLRQIRMTRETLQRTLDTMSGQEVLWG